MASGRTGWHEEGMRADIMARRGPEDVVFLTMFDLFCSTSLGKKNCQIISSRLNQAVAAAEAPRSHTCSQGKRLRVEFSID